MGKHKVGFIISALAFLVMLSPVRGDTTVALLPTQWNFISNLFPANSDGSGYHTFVGGGREALYQFDLSSIPTDATITSATLTMNMDRSQTSSPASQPIFMYRLTSSWGMGTSGSGQVDNGTTGGGGSGYTVTNNDATWNYRFYNATTPASSIPWTTVGGDFASTASAYSLVGSGMPSTPLLSTWSSTGLVSDVQNWLDGSLANDGWLLSDYASATDYPPSGNTFGSDVARRFISPSDNLNGTSGTSDDRPYLTVTYAVPEPASIGLMGMCGIAALSRRRRKC